MKEFADTNFQSIEIRGEQVQEISIGETNANMALFFSDTVGNPYKPEDLEGYINVMSAVY